MARQGGAGIFGPYQRGKRWVVLARAESGGAGTARSFPARDEAERFAAEARAAFASRTAQARTIAVALDDYAAHLVGSGQRQHAETEARCRRFFSDALDLPLAALTPRRCVALYDAACSRRVTVRSGPRKKPVRVPTERTVSVATQRGELAEARRFLVWCVTRRWLRANPLADVKPRGRKARGKAQLRIDEARAWLAHALDLAPTEPGAVAALVALLMGLRAGEIVSREVRDLDDDGRVLWIDETQEGWRPKSDASRRAVEVPEALRPHLQRLAAGREPAALLFHPPHLRGWVLFWTKKICDGAKVPRVSAHGLRGTLASVAARVVPVNLVAVLLGHTSSAVTSAHYAEPGAADEGRRRAGLKILDGGRAG